MTAPVTTFGVVLDIDGLLPASVAATAGSPLSTCTVARWDRRSVLGMPGILRALVELTIEDGRSGVGDFALVLIGGGPSRW
jgi:hypothetical protein